MADRIGEEGSKYRDMPEEHLLTPKQVAELFRVSPKTVHRWATNGQIKAIKTPGGHFRIYREDVERILRERGQSFQGE